MSTITELSFSIDNHNDFEWWIIEDTGGGLGFSVCLRHRSDCLRVGLRVFPIQRIGCNMGTSSVSRPRAPEWWEMRDWDEDPVPGRFRPRGLSPTSTLLMVHVHYVDLLGCRGLFMRIVVLFMYSPTPCSCVVGQPYIVSLLR